VQLSWDQVRLRAEQIAVRISDEYQTLYPIPRGGVYAAMALQAADRRFVITEDPLKADVFVDDIIDSGRTRKATLEKYGMDRMFVALVDKPKEDLRDWVSFPWERYQNESGPQENIVRILQAIGDNPDREGLKETPNRVVKSWGELFSGYRYDTEEKIADVLKMFEQDTCDEIVLLKNISFTSFCEHHMLPFTGVAHVAYLPKERVIGISKLARIVEIYSRRLQIQERLTQQVTKALDLHLLPRGSACVIEAHHGCMGCRGVLKPGSTMVTSSITGDFRQPATRQEFMWMIRGSS